MGHTETMGTRGRWGTQEQWALGEVGHTGTMGTRGRWGTQERWALGAGGAHKNDGH